MYEMQVQLRIGNMALWRSVRPTNGRPYQYESEQKAWETLNTYYPDTPKDRLRVVKVN